MAAKIIYDKIRNRLFAWLTDLILKTLCEERSIPPIFEVRQNDKGEKSGRVSGLKSSDPSVINLPR